MNGSLARWNVMSPQEAVREILACCCSETWATRLASKRPFQDGISLLAVADEIWRSLKEADWLEAFRSHPRIGEARVDTTATPRSSAWSAQEQWKASTATDAVKIALNSDNLAYEQKFGRTFIVCATGKSASEILKILRRRLDNDEATELRLAAEEQRQIMRIRLKKWLAE